MNIILTTLLLTSFAGEPIEQSIPIAVDGTIRVHVVSGRITVQPHDAPRVDVRAELDPDRQTLVVKRIGDGVIVRIEQPERSFNSPVNLVVRIPRRASVEVETVNADVEVEGGGAIRVQTVSGDATVMSRGPRIALKTVSGDVKVRAGTASLDVKSVNGELDAEFERLADSRIRTVNGDIRLRAKTFGDGPHRVKAQSARVRVEAADGTKIRLSVRTFGGRRILGDADAKTEMKVDSFGDQVDLKRF